MRRLLWAFAIFLLLPVPGYAQEATVTGTVVDQTGGVLPGVTVTALHEATGNTFVAVTDERGIYRLPVRVGTYRMQMELPGFANVAERFEALVGQTLTFNAQMQPSTVQESVTVTGEAPLIQTTSSTLAGNIDPRQTKDLPVNGGNWLDLSLLAPGNRSNGADPNITDGAEPLRLPAEHRRPAGHQQRTGERAEPARVAGGGRRVPVRREPVGCVAGAIERRAGERGHQVGHQHQAGSFSASFRKRKFNSPDFVQQRVLPYSNQRFNGTYGGPLRKDRAHYFVYYERETRALDDYVQQPVPDVQHRSEARRARLERRHAARLPDGRAAAPDGSRAPSGFAPIRRTRT